MTSEADLIVDRIKDVIERMTPVCALPDMGQLVNENSIRSLTEYDDGRVCGVGKSRVPNMDQIGTQVQRMRDRISPLPQAQTVREIDCPIRQGVFKDF